MAKKRTNLEAAAPPDLSMIADQLRSLAVPCAELVLDPANARRHPEANLEALKGSLRVYGQRKPVVVNRRTGAVEAGNGTLQAALELGWSHLAAVYVDDDPTTAAGFSIADNRTAELAQWDKEALGKLLQEVRTADSAVTTMLADLATANNILLTSLNGQAPASGIDELDASEEDEDGLDLLFKAPFPWFGGKSRIARMIWKRFGDVPNVIEPFFGSGAVLLNRPNIVDGTETINDYDGLVANFWRAVKTDPDKVAEFADWPVNENDLHARHLWLVERKESLQAKLEGDPEYFDAKTAGWWCWGMACWIGSGFCSGNGPWRAVTAEDGSRQLVHLGSEVRGQRSEVGGQMGNEGQGVNRQLPHIGAHASRGSNRESVKEGGNPGLGECGLLAWMRVLSDRLRRVRVCCGDWTRVCGGNSGDALAHFFAGGQLCGIFFDPPYSVEANRGMGCYNVDDGNVAHAVREWCIRHGDDPRLCIALCGYESEHQMPKSWDCVSWKAHGGMATVSRGDSQAKVNKFRERIWFSPHCLPR